MQISIDKYVKISAFRKIDHVFVVLRHVCFVNKYQKLDL